MKYLFCLSLLLLACGHKPNDSNPLSPAWIAPPGVTLEVPAQGDTRREILLKVLSLYSAEPGDTLPPLADDCLSCPGGGGGGVPPVPPPPKPQPKPGKQIGEPAPWLDVNPWGGGVRVNK